MRRRRTGMHPAVILALLVAALVVPAIILWRAAARREDETALAILAELEREGPGHVFDLVNRAIARGAKIDPNQAVLVIRRLARAGVIVPIGIAWPNGNIYSLPPEPVRPAAPPLDHFATLGGPAIAIDPPRRTDG